MPQLLENPGQALAEAVRAAASTLTAERMDLRDFVQKSWHVIEPATELKWNWHHDLLLEYLEAVYLGQVTRLVINAPPRYLKSTLISIATDRQIQVWPCADRASAEYFAAWTLRRAWRWHLQAHEKAARGEVVVDAIP